MNATIRYPNADGEPHSYEVPIPEEFLKDLSPDAPSFLFRNILTYLFSECQQTSCVCPVTWFDTNPQSRPIAVGDVITVFNRHFSIEGLGYHEILEEELSAWLNVRYHDQLLGYVYAKNNSIV